jgi:hypothetical protein
MANPEHLAKLKEGVEAWNRWRKERPKVRPDLSGADLSGTILSGVSFSGADLSRAILSGADFGLADLTEADLQSAGLSGANLVSADLRGANLMAANLRGADLRGANFVAANLRAANLGEANLSVADLSMADLSAASLDNMDLTVAIVGSTIFANVDLSRVKGLETLVHNGPSSIGLDTIYRSKGKIPHVFLRGAGVPENFIEYMASLVGTGIEFYSLFISYSTHDQEFAERLHADLQAKGVRCWFAPHDMRSGKKVHEQIDEAIRVYDKLLLILSPASMESEWVKTEIFKAREREIREKRRVLFPIRLCSFEALRDWKLFDADAGKDLAREIREYFIPDFSNWKDHDAYRKAFDRLLHDLHGKSDPPPA